MAVKAKKKEVLTKIKLQIPAGKANPAPPIGPALGQHGINIMEFCKQYNAATKDKGDFIIPVEISVYKDRSFSFILKTPPVADLLQKPLELKRVLASQIKTKSAVLPKTRSKKLRK